jgi:hypothetical protein
MATTTHVPVEVYLRSCYEPDAGYVDGQIEERSAGDKKMGIQEIRVIDPQDSRFYRYKDSQLQRKDFFSHAARGIEFNMNELKTLLD